MGIYGRYARNRDIALMPYGRTPRAPKQTVQNQIDQLKYKVARNKPETQYFKADGIAQTSTTLNPEFFTISITDALITETHGSTSFRDMVLGDRWNNLYLKLNFIFEFVNSPIFRVVVYHSALADSTWNPSSITAHVDPAAFTVLHDEFIQNSGDATQRKTLARKVNLRGLTSVYNGNSGVFEKGRLRMLVYVHSNAPGLPVFYCNQLLAFKNK